MSIYPNIDVVIPTYNSLSQKNYSCFFTIKAILSQKKVNVSLYIVDDNSTDDTLKQLKLDFNNDERIIFLRSSGKGVALARNLGAQKGSSEFLFFIDDDTVTGSDYDLVNSIKYVKGYDFACGANRFWTYLNWHDTILKEDIVSNWQNLFKEISWLPKGVDRNTGLMDITHLTFIGNFGCIRRSVFDKVEGFAEVYKGWGLEDTHFMYMLCLNGYNYKILRDSEISVYHLNHKVSKHQDFLANLKRFREYQKEVGVAFSESAFFGQYDGTSQVLKNL